MSLKVCIFGVSGYTGTELVNILDRHEKVYVNGVFGNSTNGKKLGEIIHNLKNLSETKISNYKDFDFDNTDLIFSCLPHGMLQKDIINSLNSKIPIIDLSGDFRLESFEDYEKFYKCKHRSKGLKKKFLYGLSEIYREQIKKSKFISNPGCYPTSILIPIIPLLKNNALNIDDIIVDCKSGISGAGKKPKVENLFSELTENFFSYGIRQHQHYPEIKQELNKIYNGITLTFTPHVLPVFSGIQSTIYLNKKLDEKDYKKTLMDYYKNEPFVKIYSDSKVPSIKDVKGTNNIAMNVFTDFSKKRIIIVSCIDNLIKGASGQAVQNMNIMFDFDEKESLV